MYTFTFVMEMSIVEPKIKYLFLSLYHQIHVYIEKISEDLFLFQYMAQRPEPLSQGIWILQLR